MTAAVSDEVRRAFAEEVRTDSGHVPARMRKVASTSASYDDPAGRHR
jgi:hypothetical protein